MSAKNKPNDFQRFVRGLIRSTIQDINGNRPESPINQPSPNSEAFYRDRLAKKLNGKTEVNTPVGRIDIVTKTEIIELKNVKYWKSAIGQIKSYGQYYPEHRQRIHLFGELTESKLKQIQATCDLENIFLTWQ